MRIAIVAVCVSVSAVARADDPPDPPAITAPLTDDPLLLAPTGLRGHELIDDPPPALGLAYDLGGGFKLELGGLFEHAEGRFGSRFGGGDAITVGARIVHYLRWSGGRVAWIALGIETTIWLGEPPTSQPTETFAGLRMGTTF